MNSFFWVIQVLKWNHVLRSTVLSPITSRLTYFRKRKEGSSRYCCSHGPRLHTPALHQPRYRPPQRQQALPAQMMRFCLTCPLFSCGNSPSLPSIMPHPLLHPHKRQVTQAKETPFLRFDLAAVEERGLSSFILSQSCKSGQQPSFRPIHCQRTWGQCAEGTWVPTKASFTLRFP